MFRVFISLAMVLVLCAGCSQKEKVKRVHSKHTVYEMYLQRGINSLNNFNAMHDSTQLFAAEHYIDSAFRQKNLFKFAVVPKISIFLYRAKMEEGRQYVEHVDATLFPRSYLKEMYVNFFDALIYNKKQDYQQRDASLKKAIFSVETYLQIHSKDKDGISDYFSLKMYSEPREKLFADMDAYVKKYPDSKLIVADLKRSLAGVVQKNKQ
jgi:hypothetical protein